MGTKSSFTISKALLLLLQSHLSGIPLSSFLFSFNGSIPGNGAKSPCRKTWLCVAINSNPLFGKPNPLKTSFIPVIPSGIEGKSIESLPSVKLTPLAGKLSGCTRATLNGTNAAGGDAAGFSIASSGFDSVGFGAGGAGFSSKNVCQDKNENRTKSEIINTQNKALTNPNFVFLIR